MEYKVTKTALEDVLILTPNAFEDSRGLFFESFSNQAFYNATGINATFVQDNQSISSYNVLRGLHYQVNRMQGKLVRVVDGVIFDVACDCRKNSPTLGKTVGIQLTAESRDQVWIPEGFAHGFLVLSNTATVVYKTTDYYSASDERCIMWNDKTLAIDWPIKQPPILSPKDSAALQFLDSEKC